MATWIYKLRWFIMIGWFMLAAVLITTVPPPDPTVNEQVSLLPADAPSRIAVEELQKRFPDSAGLSEAVIIFERRNSMLTAKDTEAIERVARQIDRKLHTKESKLEKQIVVRSPASLSLPTNPLTGKPVARNPLISPVGDKGQAALIIVNLPTNFITISATGHVEQIRHLLRDANLPEGLQVAVTGSAGFGYDYGTAALRSQTHTLYVTLAAVLVILLLVYRSPLAATIPLVAISLAAIVAMRLLSLGERFGIHVGTAEHIFVFVLLYGAGTDYALLLISRFHENLDLRLPTNRALPAALGATATPISASAFTDALGMLMLVFAQYAAFRTAGPAVAIALIVALLAAITLVPSMLGILGTRTFWPAKHMGQIGGRWIWPKAANLVTAHPVKVLLVTLAVLAIPMIRGANIRWIYDTMAEMPTHTDQGVGNAMAGVDIARRHWPIGEVTPVSVLIRTTKPPADPDRLAEKITDALKTTPGVQDVRSLWQPLGTGPSAMVNAMIRRVGRQKVRPEYLSDKGQAMRLVVATNESAYSLAATKTFQDIRRTVDQTLKKSDVTAQVYLAGATAEITDIRAITRSDFRRVASLCLAVIFTVIVILLRNLVLSAFMIFTIGVTYLTTLGISYWVFLPHGLDWKVEVFLFVVVAAVGVDYNIFLAARIREESRQFPRREAVRRALVFTGPVISSCGVIMAATLGSLMAGELVLLKQLGFALALGMLVDTFISRPLLLPAFTVIIGKNKSSPTATK